MDELRISSDICEEAGFAEEASFLQSISDRRCKAYVVVERGFEYNDEIYDLNEESSPRQVFLDKTTALAGGARKKRCPDSAVQSAGVLLWAGGDQQPSP